MAVGLGYKKFVLVTSPKHLWTSPTPANCKSKANERISTKTAKQSHAQASEQVKLVRQMKKDCKETQRIAPNKQWRTVLKFLVGVQRLKGPVTPTQTHF